MRYTLIAIAAIIAAIASPTVAQTPPPVATPAPAGFSVENSDLGSLLDNPAAKAVLIKHIPEIVNNDQIAMARSMTLRQLQQYSGDSLSDANLAKIQADLDKLPKQ